MPKPAADRSTISSDDFIKSPLLSAINFNSFFPTASPHFCITKGSLTEIKNISSIPLDLKFSKLLIYPGKCSFVHVGVNAPGTPTNIILLLLNKSVELTFSGEPSFNQ